MNKNLILLRKSLILNVYFRARVAYISLHPRHWLPARAVYMQGCSYEKSIRRCKPTTLILLPITSIVFWLIVVIPLKINKKIIFGCGPTSHISYHLSLKKNRKKKIDQ